MNLTRGIFGIFAGTILASFAAAQNTNMSGMSDQALPKQSGQSAFAAIHEIVGMLEADPNTDWSKVNIDALQQHFGDMNNVTLHAHAVYSPIANGERIHIFGAGTVRDSIQRMISMHVKIGGTRPTGA